MGEGMWVYRDMGGGGFLQDRGGLGEGDGEIFNPRVKLTVSLAVISPTFVECRILAHFLTIYCSDKITRGMEVYICTS